MSPRTPPDLLVCQPPSLAVLPAGARWRTVDAHDHVIGFVLQRSRRRSIGLRVDDHGLTVTAPSWASLQQVDQAVVTRHKWILDKLHLRQQQLDKLSSADTLWKDSGHIPYLGKHITLNLCPTRQHASFDGDPAQPETGCVLHLPRPYNADHSQVRDHVHAWLQTQARWWFDQRLQFFLDKAGQTLQGWRLSSATTRWGSCSSSRRIMLNWRLIHFRHALIDYVIAHEVAHLREMNHSRAFWQELERLLPEFSQARAELKQHRPGTLPLI